MASQITVNLVQGSIRFSFSPEAARELKAALATLVSRLKTIANRTSAGEARQPEEAMEYQHTGDVFLEVFCNPNIWPSPFAAKVLLTVRDERIRITTEAELTRLVEDLNQYLGQTP
ncbi:hypothetical protein XM38_016160 [Halomicronema hongdechloris C2206]|uniref:Uncharacterized protein n=1 Tax=Halomicronema hongdechloris C2206 TaxID=1641165 RepID=A0A1Z3HK33_9CYAN|nr:hypothetical protein [Halomicronema hongdechloris]ASC70671.1 hypothetical protein XM38_016160 [Halomicronema hongdechloris C2206]